MKIPYIDFRTETQLDEQLWLPSEVKMDAETRVRVYAGQLMDTVLENVTASNYLFHAGVYFKFGYRLMAKFPKQEMAITDAAFTFWYRLQKKLKEMKKAE